MQALKRKKLNKIIQTILLISAGIFLFSALTIAWIGFHDNINKSDVAIVFGSKVNPNGIVSPRLAARLDEVITLYHQGDFLNIIVSGGTGKEGVDEAMAMQQYLIAHHIDASAILVDSFGNTTRDTAKNSATIMHAHGFKSALIVSQYFHISRARLALEQCGVSTLGHAHATFFEWRDMYSLMREVIGYYDYLLRDSACTI